MQFVRKKKRGQNQKVRRTWFSEEGYRIIWRKEVCGVQVPARFQATVRVIVPHFGHAQEAVQVWDFVNGQRLFKTLKAAEEVCERHKRAWTKACEASGVRGLREIFGRLPIVIPVWARKKLKRGLYDILVNASVPGSRPAEEEEPCEPSPSDPSRTSDSSAGPEEPAPEPLTPALPAEETAPSSTRKTRRARSKATSTDESSAAPTAEAPAKARRKSVSKPTAKSSKRGGRKGKSTAASPKPAKQPSKRSRKSKSKPSGS